MQCDICLRHENLKCPFWCATCARNRLYEPRLKNAQTLLHKEDLGRQVQAATASASPTNGAKPFKKGNQGVGDTHNWTSDEASGGKDELRERTQDTLTHIDYLRKEIEAGKADIARRKAYLTQRRFNMASATRGLAEQRAVVTDSLARAAIKTDKSWDSMHTDIVNARVFLCTEAADLYGLRQRRRRKGGLFRDDYTIGGISIVDLRDLNNASPTQITVSMGRLAHLLVLTSHYLSLRLPAEVTLPHSNYPGATIFSPRSSYCAKDVPYPGSTPLQSSMTSPFDSRNGDLHPLPRPRPLYLDRNLPVLSKEDPVNYSLFVEGVTLLAWDVAWLCWTQGLHVSSGSWEEICALGKNLWRLLVELPQPRPVQKGTLSKQTDTKITTPEGSSSRSEPQTEPCRRFSLGEYSHGSARSFLGGAKGTEVMQGWKFQSPVKVIDKVKSMLLGELAGAEWEILDGMEFAQGSHTVKSEEAVLVGGVRQEPVPVTGETKSIGMNSMQAADDSVPRSDGSGGPGTGKGTSGWTKLKSRGS